MVRRKRGTPEQQARRALISELLSAANVQSMDTMREEYDIEKLNPRKNPYAEN